MSIQGFSQTALATAICRAAHQIVDADPKILLDPIALKFIDEASLAALRARDPSVMAWANPAARVHFGLRNRIAEDCLEQAVARGLGQYVVLGAGLDSFAYRQPDWARHVRIVEVDHPKTQELKLGLVKSQTLGPPQNVAYLPVDFARDPLLACLERSRLDTKRPIFVAWLGVTQYLVPDSVAAVLRDLAAWSGGCGLVLTYMLSDWSAFPPEAIARFELQRDRAASVGEPWLSGYSELSMAATLRSAGFTFQKTFAVDHIQRRYFDGRTDGLKAEGGPSRIAAAHTAAGDEAWFIP